MASRNSVVVLIGRYQMEHNKRPRGYGNWFFSISGKGGSYIQDWLGTWSECKEKAIKFAMESDCRLVKVLP